MGTTSGVSFLVTSVISGVLVGVDGMRSVLVLALVVLSLALVHLSLIPVPAPAPAPQEEGATRIDVRGTLRVVRTVSGLAALIVFSCFNNFLGGAFMALMDPYGLSLMPVKTWGILWGVLSTGFIIGGLLVAKTGLGSPPASPWPVPTSVDSAGNTYQSRRPLGAPRRLAARRCKPWVGTTMHRLVSRWVAQLAGCQEGRSGCDY